MKNLHITKPGSQNAAVNGPRGTHHGKAMKHTGQADDGKDLSKNAKNCTGDYYSNRMLGKGPRVRNHSK